MAARFSQLFAPTLKQAPVDAIAPSHQLLLRAGFVRQLAAGLYSFLPLGWRSLRKLSDLIRHEMDAIGAQEFLLPSLHPAEVWRESGRWDEIDDTMYRLKDRRGADFCLGMTHEEIFTAIARSDLRSYRDLPSAWYQVGPKFRDEPRPKAGLLRGREFLMKDAYSFDVDAAGLDVAFGKMREAYERVFARCGVTALGGSSLGPIEDPPAVSEQPERFPTPGVLTIDALAAPPYGVPPERQLKTLVYVADDRPVVAVVRGDHALGEAKLQSATEAKKTRPAQVEEVLALMGAYPGSLGAVGFSRAPVLVDQAVAPRTNMVTGANQDGFHLRGVDVGRDVLAGEHARVADLRVARGGEGCPTCGAALESFAALEVGHIFKLGTRYSERLGATVLNAEGAHVPLVMGSYGIGVSRLLAAVVEQNYDADGIRWPVPVAPVAATVLTLGDEPELAALSDEVARELEVAGLDVLVDDRAERPGVKFKDADLIGCPVRIAVGRRGLAERTVEWKLRRDPEARVTPVDQLRACVQEMQRG